MLDEPSIGGGHFARTDGKALNLATIVSICASVIEVCVAGLMVGLSRAAGWKRSSLFVGIALTSAVYSALDVITSVSGAPDDLRSWGLRASYAIGGLHCAAWLVYVFGDPTKPRWGMNRWLIALGLSSTLLGLSALIPNLAVSSTAFHDLEFARLGVHYRKAINLRFGYLVGLWITLTLFVPYVEYARRSIRGDRRAFAPLGAFTIFWLCVVNEVLVDNRVYVSLLLAEVGFLAIVLVAVIETVGRVVRDAQTLNVLSRSLDREAQNRTRERDDARGALMRAERAAAFGGLARGATSEIDNPLTCIHTNLEYVRDQLGGLGASEDMVHALDDAVAGALHIRSIVGELQAYATDREGQRRRVAVSSVVHSALQLLGSQAKNTAHIEEDFGPIPLVLTDRLRLLQVFVNLLTNALEAVVASDRPSERTITIRTGLTSTGYACVEISDTGEGILSEDLGRVMDPFFTTRQHEGRAGLGLYIARSIVESIGGRVDIESERGVGTTVRLVLPNGEGDDTPIPEFSARSPHDDESSDRERFLSLRVEPAPRLN